MQTEMFGRYDYYCLPTQTATCICGLELSVSIYTWHDMTFYLNIYRELILLRVLNSTII